jgi:hypothetical protein
VQSQGEIRQPVQQSTVFYVEAHGLLGKPAHRCATGFVNEALPLAGISQCSGPRRVGIGVARPSGSRWSARAKVGPVKNTNDVTVTVSHGGITETLAPGVTSAAFANSDPNGGWAIEGHNTRVKRSCLHCRLGNAPRRVGTLSDMHGH